MDVRLFAAQEVFMQQFSEDDVRRLLPMRECIEALRSAFREYAAGQAVNQPRRRLYLDTGSVLHALAGANSKYFGTKIYSSNPKHGANFFLLLFDAATARPLAQFDANHLGQIRTGAATGLAVDLLAPSDVGTLAVIGSGFQARTQVEAVRAVRDVKQVRVWSRHADKRASFAVEVGGEACDTAEQAVRAAEIVVTATWAKSPVLEAAWVRPDAIVCAVGSNDPGRREIPGELVEKAATLVLDDLAQGRMEAGDYCLALDDQGWERVISLATLVVEGPRRRPGISVFKSVGLGLEDVAAAAVVFEKAASQT
jgi:alanine dehydrogenase